MLQRGAGCFNMLLAVMKSFSPAPGQSDASFQMQGVLSPSYLEQYHSFVV